MSALRHVLRPAHALTFLAAAAAPAFADPLTFLGAGLEAHASYTVNSFYVGLKTKTVDDVRNGLTEPFALAGNRFGIELDDHTLAFQSAARTMYDYAAFDDRSFGTSTNSHSASTLFTVTIRNDHASPEPVHLDFHVIPSQLSVSDRTTAVAPLNGIERAELKMTISTVTDGGPSQTRWLWHEVLTGNRNNFTTSGNVFDPQNLGTPTSHTTFRDANRQPTVANPSAPIVIEDFDSFDGHLDFGTLAPNSTFTLNYLIEAFATGPGGLGVGASAAVGDPAELAAGSPSGKGVELVFSPNVVFPPLPEPAAALPCLIALSVPRTRRRQSTLPIRTNHSAQA